MSIFNFITLFGGLAFFLYGMNIMSNGLEQVAGSKLEDMLRKVTSKKFLALLVGAGITIAIQSSSALTVMLVGLVNAGIMRFGETIGILMGSNIGTTLTAWILSLAGIESDNIIMSLLKPKNFAPIFALIGIILIMVAKSQKKKSIGNILIGFSILMSGMTLMSDAMAPLSEMPEFVNILTAFKNPILAVIFGAVFTGIIQSSAASVGILQALSLTGSITYSMAIPIIMGQNIGTCVTAVLSSIGVSKNAKKVAVVHLMFNIFGTLICLIPFLVIDAIFTLPFADSAIDPFMIAVVHSIFNVATTFILLPFTKVLEKLANMLVKEATFEVNTTNPLDERLLTVPSVAVATAFNEASDMAALAVKAYGKSIDLLTKFSEADFEKVSEMETALDNYEDQLGTYLVKLSKIEVPEKDNKTISVILHAINDFERIGDHAQNLSYVAKEINDKHIDFSSDAKKEIMVLHKAIVEILDTTLNAFQNRDAKAASNIEPLEQVIDTLIDEIKSRHINRLKKGECTIELGFVLTDLLTNLERISDHCSNIGVAVIEGQHGTFDTHEYLHHMKEDSESFNNLVEAYAEKFDI